MLAVGPDALDSLVLKMYTTLYREEAVNLGIDESGVKIKVLAQGPGIGH